MRTRKTVVILLSGKAGSGKSTVSNILKDKLLEIPTMTVFQYSFAGPLKYIAEAFILWDGKKDEKGRKLLQNLGKDGREYDQDIWVKHLINQMDRKAGLLPFNFVIVDDWRFPNECTFLRKNGLLEVVTVRLCGRGGLDGDTAKDVSEISLPEIDKDAFTWNYDFVIHNDGDLNSLEKKVDEILASISKQYIVE